MTGNDADRPEARPPGLEPSADKLPRFAIELPPSDDGGSFLAYQQNSAPMCDISLPAGASPSGFWFNGIIYQMPHGVMYRASSAAHNMLHGPAHTGEGKSRDITMIAQISGQAHTRCGKRDLLLGPGDIVFYNHAQEYYSEVSEFRMMALMIARDQVPPLFLSPAVHGAVLPAASAGAQLLFGTLETLFETADGLTLAEADAAVDAAFTMAGGALQAVLTRAGEQFSYGDPMMDKALAFIDRHITDPNLTPAGFEAHLAVSRSSLYRLFEPHGGVGAVVLRRRLDRSMKAMLTTVNSGLSLRKIAADYGFRGETHFSRAFRARFGITPRAFNELVRRKDYAGLSVQAERAGFTSLQSWLDFLSREPGND